MQEPERASDENSSLKTDSDSSNVSPCESTFMHGSVVSSVLFLCQFCLQMKLELFAWRVFLSSVLCVVTDL